MGGGFAWKKGSSPLWGKGEERRGAGQIQRLKTAIEVSLCPKAKRVATDGGPENSGTRLFRAFNGSPKGNGRGGAKFTELGTLREFIISQ